MMNRIEKRIRTAMTDEGLTRVLSLEGILYLMSLAYGGAVCLRNAGYRKGMFKTRTLPCAVVSIGNLTVGGTGKTPMTIHVSRLIKRLGYSVAVLSRGYRGAAEQTGAVVSDGRSILAGPQKAGDEPFMMARRLEGIPVIVGRNRFDAGLLAIRTTAPEVIVMDDAYQHLALKRDLNLLLIDSCRPFGNSYLLPRGPLREPLSAMQRADAFILTRFAADRTAIYDRIRTRASGRPVFRSQHLPDGCRIMRRNDLGAALPAMAGKDGFARIKSRPVFAFSGIARNGDFRSLLSRLGCHLKGFAGFSDHHAYTSAELDRILESATQSGCELIVTTEKDFVRISDRIDWPLDLAVIGIETVFGDDRDEFDAFIKQRLEKIMENKRRSPGEAA